MFLSIQYDDTLYVVFVQAKSLYYCDPVLPLVLRQVEEFTVSPKNYYKYDLALSFIFFIVFPKKIDLAFTKIFLSRGL